MLGPIDAGGVVSPNTPALTLRDWQRAALPIAIAAIHDQPGEAPAMVAACTGSGKSILLAVVIRDVLTGITAGDRVVMVTTPTRSLVAQLAATLARILAEPIGQHYTDRKWRGERVVVTCHPSALDLVNRIAESQRRIGLWIADEAHRTESPQIHAMVEQVRATQPPPPALGFSATPYRSMPGATLALWGRQVVTYSPTDAIRDGAIVPWRTVRWTGPESTLDTVCRAMIANAPPGAGVVSATTIEDAEGFAELLTGDGIPAQAIHSRLNERTRAALLAAHAAGTLRVLVHPSVLKEGVDLPYLRWGCLRAKRSRVDLTQELGRFLRNHDTPALGKKTAAIMLDPLGQLESYSPTIDAALGWGDDLDSTSTPALEPGPTDIEAFDRPPTIVQPIAAATAWLLALLEAALLDGRTTAPKGRKGPPTPRQRTVLVRNAPTALRIGTTHGPTLKRFCTHPDLIASGRHARQLTALLQSLRQTSWTPPDDLPPPPGDATVRQALKHARDRPWHAAGAHRAGRIALMAEAPQGKCLRAVGDISLRVTPAAAHMAAYRLVVLRLIGNGDPIPRAIAFPDDAHGQHARDCLLDASITAHESESLVRRDVAAMARKHKIQRMPRPCTTSAHSTGGRVWGVLR